MLNRKRKREKRGRERGREREREAVFSSKHSASTRKRGETQGWINCLEQRARRGVSHHFRQCIYTCKERDREGSCSHKLPPNFELV